MEAHLGAIIDEHKELMGNLAALTKFINEDPRNECEKEITPEDVKKALIELEAWRDFTAGADGDDIPLDILQGGSPEGAEGKKKRGPPGEARESPGKRSQGSYQR